MLINHEHQVIDPKKNSMKTDVIPEALKLIRWIILKKEMKNSKILIPPAGAMEMRKGNKVGLGMATIIEMKSVAAPSI